MCPFGFNVFRWILWCVFLFFFIYFFFCFHAFQGGRRQNLLFTRKMSLFTHYFSTVHALFIGSTATLPITTSFYGLSEQGMGRDCGKTLFHCLVGGRKNEEGEKVIFSLFDWWKWRKGKGKLMIRFSFPPYLLLPFFTIWKGRERN